jgi:membrane protein
MSDLTTDSGWRTGPRPGPTGTLWAFLVGWALVRLIIGRTAGNEAPQGPASARSGAPRESTRSSFPSTKQHASAGAQGEAERGRRAETPTEIPSRGWKDIAWRVYEQFGKDRVMSVAAGVTYYTLLAIFPAIAALVSIYGLFADPATIQTHLSALSGVLPDGAVEIIGDQVKRISSQGGGTLGLSFVIGLLIALWSANAGMKAVFDALNIVYGEEEKRSFIKLNLWSLGFTVGAILFLLLALAGIVALPVVLNYVGLGSGLEWLIRLGRWPVLLIVVVAALAVLYRYGPSRDQAEWKWLTPGSIFAAVVWLVGSILFSWYVANFGSYNETYGSLGAVIGFMTWIWLSAVVVLTGAEINAEIEHQTAHDTTVGHRQPMGARGATMADTVGAAKA